MKKIVRLTESDLIRIVKRVIKEEMTQVNDKTWTSQGYGKDPYQYKATLVRGTGNWGTATYSPEFYVAKKGPNPKWIKITDENAKQKISTQQFPNLDYKTHGETENSVYKSVTRGDAAKAFAEIFPCVEQSMKPTDKKEFRGEGLVYIIDGITYSVEKNPSSKLGWEIKAQDPKYSPLESARYKTYKTCEEFKNRKK